MSIARRTRLAQKRRWRPRLNDIVRRTIRKNLPAVLANMTRNNALFERLNAELRL